MKKSSPGLGKLVYMEWLFPIKDYYFSIRLNEAVFEIIIPVAISVFCSVQYVKKDLLFTALHSLSELLPTAISILIGFTVMLITLLLTSNGDRIKTLEEKTIGKKLYKKELTLYQSLHIQFAHSLFSEVTLLLIIFLYLFWSGLGIPICCGLGLLIIEIYLTLNILLSILRGITNIYFSFFKLTK